MRLRLKVAVSQWVCMLSSVTQWIFHYTVQYVMQTGESSRRSCDSCSHQSDGIKVMKDSKEEKQREERRKKDVEKKEEMRLKLF